MTEEELDRIYDKFDQQCEKQDCKDCKYSPTFCEFEFAYELGKAEALGELIDRTTALMDDIHHWDEDDHENGLRDGYKHSIEIAKEIKR